MKNNGEHIIFGGRKWKNWIITKQYVWKNLKYLKKKKGNCFATFMEVIHSIAFLHLFYVGICQLPVYLQGPLIISQCNYCFNFCTISVCMCVFSLSTWSLWTLRSSRSFVICASKAARRVLKLFASLSKSLASNLWHLGSIRFCGEGSIFMLFVCCCCSINM